MEEKQNSWFDEPEQDTHWLVDGLITIDDNAGFVGKPKSGKSTSIRNLVAAVVVGGQFLGRDVLLAQRTGRVLYLHLDRKDRRHRVASDLRKLGITREDSKRVRFLTEHDVPKESTFEERCLWLATQVNEFKPNLVVIDLLFQFVRTKKGINDYDDIIDALAHLQDSLNTVQYKGALLMSLHARKAISEDVGDSMLGSTGLGGSMSTHLFFHQYKKQKLYTVESSQTIRDPQFEDLEETIVNRDSQTGAITLAAKFADLKIEEKRDEAQLRRNKVFGHIVLHPQKSTDDLMKELSMSKKVLLPILEALENSNLIGSTGEGKRGDPKKWSPVGIEETIGKEAVCNN